MIYDRLKKYLTTVKKVDGPKSCEALWQMLEVEDVVEQKKFAEILNQVFGLDRKTARNTRRARTINANVRIGDPRCTMRECDMEHKDLFVESKDGKTFWRFVPVIHKEIKVKYYDVKKYETNKGKRNMKSVMMENNQ
jgi:hypothetical protein